MNIWQIDGMEFIPSPNFNARKNNKTIRHLILHYTDTPNLQMAVDMLCDPVGEVSAHYVVDLDGGIVQLVDEANRAWHAGKSFWDGEADINSTSIGIEIVNPGHTFGHQPYPPQQIASVMDLCHDILSRHKILPQHILAHSDIAPARKQDPGALFPWKLLAENGIGLFPHIPLPQSKTMGERSALCRTNGPAQPGEGVLISESPSPNLSPASGGEELEKYGYDISNLPAAITAFQRHFRADQINGEWDEACGVRLGALLAAIQSV